MTVVACRLSSAATLTLVRGAVAKQLTVLMFAGPWHSIDACKHMVQTQFALSVRAWHTAAVWLCGRPRKAEKASLHPSPSAP
eukprot:COSAG01_NODE_7206_length_3305_cov_2.118216_1_plen_81_part_10